MSESENCKECGQEMAVVVELHALNNPVAYACQNRGCSRNAVEVKADGRKP